MTVISREELDRLLVKADSYDATTKRDAAERIRGHFDDARQALAEHEALTRNLQKQTDEKVDLQVRVRELERELATRPFIAPSPGQPMWPIPQPTEFRQKTGFPNYSPGVRGGMLQNGIDPDDRYDPQWIDPTTDDRG